MSTLEIDKIPTVKEEEILSTLMEQQNGTVNETLIKSETKDDADAQVKLTSRTLALIKPDAMQANHKNEIINKIKENKFDIVQEKQLLLSKEKAGLFYKEHEGKSFYQDLTNWMSSSPIYALILEKEDAVQSWRNLMGPTNSNKARDVEPNSIRALFGTDGSQNATHGSDSQDSAEREIALIFDENETHVVEIQGLVDEFNTHDVCKPDAIIEPEQQQQLPEVKAESNSDNNDPENGDNEKTLENIVVTEHLHTADLVTSEDNVTDLSQKEDETTNAVSEEEAKINEIIETSSATTINNNNEEPIIDQVDVSLDVKIDAAMQGPTTVSDTVDVDIAIADIPTSDSNKPIPDTTQDDIKKHVTDTVSLSTVTPNDDKQIEIEMNKKQVTKPIESCPVLKQQDAKIEPETVVTEAEIVANTTAKVADSEKEIEEDVANLENEQSKANATANVADLENKQSKANVDIENQIRAEIVETKDKPDVQEESNVAENVKETEDLHENDAALEPAASVTEEILEAHPSAIAITVESNQETGKLDTKEPITESLSVDEQKKQDEPVITASIIVNDINENSEKSIVNVDIVPVTVASTVGVQENDESDIIPGVTTDVVPETKYMQSDVIVDDENKQPEAKNIEITLAEGETEPIKDAKLNESVIQEKEVVEEEVSSEQSGDLVSATPTTTTTTSSNDNSSQSSKNSSVTEKSQVQENKDKIKETNVNKKQPKLKTPGASSTGIRSITRPNGSVAADKKKATSTTATGLRKPATTTLKKKVDVKEQHQEEKPKTKTRVPRVALLSQPKKKPIQDATAAASTEVKTKKATVSTRSLVSRLTAPTAASARKKTSSADGNTTTTTATIATTTKPADAVRQKKLSSATPTSTVKKVSSSSAAAGTSVAGKRTLKMTTKPTIPSSSAAATTTKKPATTTGVRRISPPTSTTASKKVDGTVKRTTGTRATASGLPSSTTISNGKTSTRKETLSTGSKLKKTTPATTVKKSAAISPKTKADATSSTDSTPKASSVSSVSVSSSTSSLDNHAVVSEELEAIKLETVSPPLPSAPPATDEIANEAEKLQENGLDNDNVDDSINNINNVDQELNEKENESDVIISSSINVTGDEKMVAEKQDDIIVDLPEEEINNEQEVLSVNITKQQENVVIVEPATPVAANQESDAEVAAITTQPAATTAKPQMASLRSRFENLNNNNNTNNTLNNNQLHTTSSKEIRSKSPNRISDMINRFQ